MEKSRNSEGSLKLEGDYVVERYVDGRMLQYLIDYWGVRHFEVVDGLVSKEYITGEDLFKEKHQDELKKKASDVYNEVLREIIKLFLNGLCGKLIEDPSQYERVVPEKNSSLVINNTNVSKQSNNDCNSWIPVGVLKYSYSKRLLAKYICMLPHGSQDVLLSKLTASISITVAIKTMFLKRK